MNEKKLKYKIIIGCDHAGYLAAQAIHTALKEHTSDIALVGASSATESYDYPDAAQTVAEGLKQNYDYGILLCGTGIGVSIKANRYPHIRAALCWNRTIATLAREHNNANVLCLAARFITFEEALACANAFLKTSFEGGTRHERRILKL